MRVVFDTNIFVSALTLPGGRAQRALDRIAEGRDVLVISRDIIDELLSVLASKFGRDAEQLAHTAFFLAQLGEVVIPSQRYHVLSDEADNRILECAAAGHADAIVTGDQQMLALRAFRGAKIITLRALLES